jgi:hypothetical protein
MALTKETRLGSYEVLEQLGAGGTGEMHQARDIKFISSGVTWSLE